MNTNRPSGSSSIDCDSGVPISGRTSPTGTYEILKVNADGSLPGLPASETQVPSLVLPGTTTTNPPGILIAGIMLIYEQITPTNPLTAGLYQGNPWIQFEATPTGAVNCAIVRVGSAMDSYILTRSLGFDDFQPTANDFLNGFAMWWHNLPLQDVGGGNAGIVTQITQEKNFVLTAGDYKVLYWVHTDITITNPTTLFGFSQFNKLG